MLIIAETFIHVTGCIGVRCIVSSDTCAFTFIYLSSLFTWLAGTFHDKPIASIPTWISPNLTFIKNCWHFNYRVVVFIRAEQYYTCTEHRHLNTRIEKLINRSDTELRCSASVLDHELLLCFSLGSHLLGFCFGFHFSLPEAANNTTVLMKKFFTSTSQTQGSWWTETKVS